jgi:L-asparagine transporter-like permease
MFDEIPPRQSIRDKMRKWTEIGWYILTGFFVSGWSELLAQRRLLALALGAAWILLWLAVLWAMSGFRNSARRSKRTKRFHLTWMAASAVLSIILLAAFFRNLAPFESALGLYCALGVFVNHIFWYFRITKLESLEDDNPHTRLNHG